MVRNGTEFTVRERDEDEHTHGRVARDKDDTPRPWNIPLNSKAGPCGVARERGKGRERKRDGASAREREREGEREKGKRARRGTEKDLES